MLRLLCLLAVCVLILVAASFRAFALDARSGNMVTIASGVTVDDDLAAAGQSVTISGKVNGDAMAAGQSVLVPGVVAGTLWAAGNTVDVRGKIGRSVWMAGQNVTLESSVPGNASLAGSSVLVSETAKIGRGLYAAGASVIINGSVGRELKAAGDTVTLNGPVGGDARIEAKTVRLEKGALIRGTLTYVSEKKLSAAEEARVAGDIVHRYPTHRRAEKGGWVWWKIYWILATIVFGLAIVGLYPARSLAAGQLSRTMFWQSLLWGLLILIVTPIVAGIVLITIVGIPISLIILASYLILIFASRVYAGIGLGDWIQRKAGRASPNTILSMLIGVVIIGLLSMIPWIGWLISFIALLVGLGAVMIDWARWIRALRARGEA